MEYSSPNMLVNIRSHPRANETSRQLTEHHTNPTKHFCSKFVFTASSRILARRRLGDSLLRLFATELLPPVTDAARVVRTPLDDDVAVSRTFSLFEALLLLAKEKGRGCGAGPGSLSARMLLRRPAGPPLLSLFDRVGVGTAVEVPLLLPLLPLTLFSLSLFLWQLGCSCGSLCVRLTGPLRRCSLASASARSPIPRCRSAGSRQTAARSSRAPSSSLRPSPRRRAHSSSANLPAPAPNDVSGELGEMPGSGPPVSCSSKDTSWWWAHAAFRGGCSIFALPRRELSPVDERGALVQVALVAADDLSV
ncbi:hypothetical protein DL770_003577 [Monosporascus sp. CRB-9-2]|nr:hypothetical protein DL770_003577 [Monosporascus sp. CRB-9-2]